MKSYEIIVGIGDELMFLYVPKAVNEDAAIQQVYDSDQVNEYDAEDVEHLEIIKVVEELEE